MRRHRKSHKNKRNVCRKRTDRVDCEALQRTCRDRLVDHLANVGAGRRFLKTAAVYNRRLRAKAGLLVAEMLGNPI